VISLRLSEHAGSDLRRIHAFIANEDLRGADSAIELILDALNLLERHPLIGRVVTDSLRELIISHGNSGYIALYSYDAKRKRVLVKAIRHQREAGFDETGA
jgi:plasmid stabilization system protein ParE